MTRDRRAPSTVAGWLWQALAIAGCAAASALVLVALLLPGEWAAWAMAVAAGVAPSSLVAIGVWRRDGRHRGLAGVVVGLAVWLTAVLGGLVAVAGSGATGLVGGLPLPAAVAVWGLWLLPLLPACLAFALTFDSSFLTAEDVERLRRLDEPPPGEGG